MTRIRFIAAGSLIAGLVLGLGVSSFAQTGRRPKTLQDRLARATNLPLEDVDKVLNAMGDAVVQEMSEGKTVNLPGLGTFRLVRQPETRDIHNTRPVIIPAHNTIEFVSATSAENASNGETVRPAEVVPPEHFNVLPGQTPGMKSSGTRAPIIRTTGY